MTIDEQINRIKELILKRHVLLLSCFMKLNVSSGFRLVFITILALTGSGNGRATAFAAELTRVGESQKLCVAPIIGLEPKSAEDPRRYPKWGPAFGDDCVGQRAALKLSVTHENMRNTHFGSRNYDPNVAAYMADFDFEKDFGRWLSASVRSENGASVLSLKLDTIDFDEVNVTTGWPLRYGHLFVGLNDSTAIFSLDRDAVVEFDLRLASATVSQALNPAYSGRRVMVGAVAKWDEAPPRTNTAHYLEADLMLSPGYSRMYNEKPRPGCDDLDYDRCFYSDNGQYAEGREIGFQKTLHGPELASDPQAWTHVRIPLGAAYRSLPWLSKPESWSVAKVTGIYIGIESIGATNSEIEIKNYRIQDIP